MAPKQQQCSDSSPHLHWVRGVGIPCHYTLFWASPANITLLRICLVQALSYQIIQAHVNISNTAACTFACSTQAHSLVQDHTDKFITVFHPCESARTSLECVLSYSAAFYRVASFNQPYDQPGGKDTWDSLTHESLTPFTCCYPSEWILSLPNHIGSGSCNANARGRGWSLGQHFAMDRVQMSLEEQPYTSDDLKWVEPSRIQYNDWKLYLKISGLWVTELLCIICCQPHKWPHWHKKTGALTKLSKSHVTKASLWHVILDPSYGFMTFSSPELPEHRTNSMLAKPSSLSQSTEVCQMCFEYLPAFDCSFLCS